MPAWFASFAESYRKLLGFQKDDRAQITYRYAPPPFTPCFFSLVCSYIRHAISTFAVEYLVDFLSFSNLPNPRPVNSRLVGQKKCAFKWWSDMLFASRWRQICHTFLTHTDYDTVVFKPLVRLSVLTIAFLDACTTDTRLTFADISVRKATFPRRRPSMLATRARHIRPSRHIVPANPASFQTPDMQAEAISNATNERTSIWCPLALLS